MLRNPSFSSRDLTVLMMSPISSFEINNIVVPKPRILTAVDDSAVNPNGIKTLHGVSTFLIKGKAVFSNGPRSLSGNPPDSTILDS